MQLQQTTPEKAVQTLRKLKAEESELLNLIAELIVEIIIKETDKDNHRNNPKLE